MYPTSFTMESTPRIQAVETFLQVLEDIRMDLSSTSNVDRSKLERTLLEWIEPNAEISYGPLSSTSIMKKSSQDSLSSSTSSLLSLTHNDNDDEDGVVVHVVEEQQKQQKQKRTTPSITDTLKESLLKRYEATQSFRFHPLEQGAHEYQVIRQGKRRTGLSSQRVVEVFELVECTDDETTFFKIKSCYLRFAIAGGNSLTNSPSRRSKQTLRDAFWNEIDMEAEIEERLRVCAFID